MMTCWAVPRPSLTHLARLPLTIVVTLVLGLLLGTTEWLVGRVP